MLTPRSIDLLFSKQTKRRFVLAIAASAVAALADAAGVLVMLPLMQLLTGASRDSGLLSWLSSLAGDPSDTRLAIYLALLTFSAFLFKAVVAISVRWWVLGFVYKQEAETSVGLLRYYLGAPYGLHLRRNSADLIRTMNDANGQVHSLVIVATMSAVAEGLTMFAVSLGLVILMPAPTLAVGFYLVVAGVAFHRVVRRRARAAGDRLLDSFVGIYQAALQALSGIKEIKVRRKAEYFLGKYSAARARHAEARRVATFLGELPKYVFEVLFIIGIGLATVIVFSTSPSDEALSVLALFAAAGFRLLPSMVRLIASLSQIRIGESALEMVVAEIERARANEWSEQLVAPSGRADRLISDDTIEIDNVSFTHEGASEPALDAVSLTIPSSSAVALVGASGSGKSTLVDIILGLHTPASGTVVVGGRDIRTFLPEWQSSVGMVPQDVYLLDDSLRANIAFGEWDDDIDDARVRDALALAQLDELIGSLPDGVDTYVGERGVRLSGGQRQRIGIARALYSRPKLLVMDEATSALDNETEQRITQTIADLHGQMTMLLVAHRLSTVRHCDQIAFLNHGRITDVGTFDELRLRNAEFAELTRLGSLQ